MPLDPITCLALLTVLAVFAVLVRVSIQSPDWARPVRTAVLHVCLLAAFQLFWDHMTGRPTVIARIVAAVDDLVSTTENTEASR